MEEILTRRPEVFLPAPANGSLGDVCSPGEWETRVELAAVFRLVNKYGLDDMANGAICARVKDSPDHYLLHPYGIFWDCLLYTSPSPRDGLLSRMPSSA